jgi:hypothetical protein
MHGGGQRGSWFGDQPLDLARDEIGRRELGENLSGDRVADDPAGAIGDDLADGFTVLIGSFVYHHFARIAARFAVGHHQRANIGELVHCGGVEFTRGAQDQPAAAVPGQHQLLAAEAALERMADIGDEFGLSGG